jgi:hypothetical protein
MNISDYILDGEMIWRDGTLGVSRKALDSLQE